MAAGKLARVGLIPEREAAATATLVPFLTLYLDGRAELKPVTKIVRGQVRRDLKEFFGESREVGTITPAEAENFRRYLV